MRSTFLLFGVSLMLGFLLLSCDDDDDEVDEGGPTLENIMQNPEDYYGQNVSVVGEVHEVVGRYLVTLTEEGFPVVMGEEVSLNFFNAVGSPYLDVTLIVQGQVQEFGTPEFESVLDVELEGYEVYEGEPSIIASSVEIALGEAEDVESGSEQGTTDIDDPDVLPPVLPPADTDDGPQFSCAATDTISWNAAGDHVGTEVTVIGPVYEVESSDGQVTVTLGSDLVVADRRLEIVLTENATEHFRTGAADVFEDSQVCVRGVVQETRGGQLQMVVNEPQSIWRL